MVVVPAGSFMMGTEFDDRFPNEKPPHKVSFARNFAVGKYEITFREWDACSADHACPPKPDDRGWGREHSPAVFIIWDEAMQYVRWLKEKTGKSYHLISEAQWEYAARGGEKSDIHGKENGNCDGCGGRWDNKRTSPSGSFPANGFGLYDMLGNAWEWTRDCWNEDYWNAPADGGPWLSGDCKRHPMRGGSWSTDSWLVRTAIRTGFHYSAKYFTHGLRVSRDIN